MGTQDDYFQLFSDIFINQLFYRSFCTLIISMNVQLVSVSGELIGTYSMSNPFNQLKGLFIGHFMEVTDTGCLQLSDDSHHQGSNLRVVYAEADKDYELLQKLETVSIFLRFPNTKAKKIEMNLYKTSHQLYEAAYQLTHSPMKLYVDGQEIIDSNEPLIRRLYQNAIVHIIPVNQETKLKKIYIKQPFNQAKAHTLVNIDLNLTVQQLIKQASNLLEVAEQDLILVYGGRAMKPIEKLNSYNLVDQCLISAIDQKKHLKKVSLQTYKTLKAQQQNKSETMKQLYNRQKNKPLKTDLFSSIQEQETHKFNELKKQIQQSKEEDSKGNIEIVDRSVIRGPDIDIESTVKTVRNKDGDIIKTESDVIETEKTQSGNHHIHEKIQVQEKCHEILINMDQDVNDKGEVARVQMDYEEIEEANDGTIFRHEEDTVQEGDRIVKSEVNLVGDKEGNITDAASKKTEIEKDKSGKIHMHQTEIHKKDHYSKETEKDLLVDDLAETQIHGNNSNLEEKFIENLVFNDTDKITKEEQIFEDEAGNIHTHTREIRNEYNGKRVCIETDKVTDQNNTNIKQEADYEIDVKGSDNKIHHLKGHVVSGQGKTVMKGEQYIENEKGEQTCIENFEKTYEKDKSGNINEKQIDLINTQQANEPKKKFESFDDLEQNSKLAESTNLLQSLQKQDTFKEEKIVEDSLMKVYENAIEEVSQDKINIKVKELQGIEWDLQIQYDDAIDDVKDRFAEKTKIDRESITFYRDGKALEDYEMCAQLGIMEDLTLYIEIAQ